jgi:DNA transformation protein and related proteins
MSTEFVAWCCELLAPLGPVRSRRMFGGHGLYVGDLFVAILAGERLYLKVDEATRASFEAAGSAPFHYTTARGERGVMSYWAMPDDGMDGPDQAQPWARLALASALRASAAKQAEAARKPSAARRQSPAAPPPRKTRRRTPTGKA